MIEKRTKAIAQSLRVRKPAHDVFSCLVLFVFVLLPIKAVSVSAQTHPVIDDELTLIDGLRQRRLFDLADLQCRQLMGLSDLDSISQASLAIELIKTGVARGIVSSGQQRAESWQMVDKVPEDFLKQYPDHPRKLLVEVQQAVAHLTYGRLIGQEVAAEILPESSKSQAIEQLREAIGSLRNLESRIDDALPKQRSRNLDSDELTPDQLLNLKQNIKYQAATASLAMAELFAADDKLNRIDALNQVLTRLNDVLKQTGDDQPLWWNAQLDRIKCFRLLGNFGLASQAFAKLAEAKLTSDLQSRFVEEQIRLAIASNQLDSAASRFSAASKIQSPTPELQLAMLELSMFVSRSASADEQQKWKSTATELTKAIEARHGPYWGRRAELLLIGSAGGAANQPPTAGASSDLEIVARVGDAAMRRGNFADAVKAYDRAAELAATLNNDEQAFVMTVRSSQALEKLPNHELASEKLIAIAKRLQESRLASSAHLRGCWNYAQSSQNAEIKQQKFAELLQEHIQLWPDEESADQARLWLARQLQSGKKWNEAMENYLAISIDSPQMVEATRQIGICAWQLFSDADEQNKTNQARKLVLQIREKLGITGNQPKTRWNEAERILATLLARIGLMGDGAKSDFVAELLDSALQEADDRQSAWKQEARAWKVVALAAEPEQISLASQQLKDLPNDPQLMKICLEGLAAIHGENVEVVKLQLIACDKTLSEISDDSDKSESQWWRTRKAIVLRRLGENKQALKLLSELATENPKSLTIRLESARALSELVEAPERALDAWRRLAAQVKPGSEAWFESKYEIARLLDVTGQSGDALKLLKYIQAIPPGWNQSAIKQKFETLLKDLEH